MRAIATKFLEHFSTGTEFNANVESFIGIPLILTMIAEIYMDNVLIFLKNPEKIFNLVKLSLVGIYRGFIKKKF